MRSAGPTTSDRGNQHRQRQSALGFAQWSKHRVRGTNNRYRQRGVCLPVRLGVCLSACLPVCLPAYLSTSISVCPMFRIMSKLCCIRVRRRCGLSTSGRLQQVCGRRHTHRQPSRGAGRLTLPVPAVLEQETVRCVCCLPGHSFVFGVWAVGLWGCGGRILS